MHSSYKFNPVFGLRNIDFLLAHERHNWIHGWHKTTPVTGRIEQLIEDGNHVCGYVIRERTKASH